MTLPALSHAQIKEKEKANTGHGFEGRNLILVRHGETKLNADGDRIRGWSDIPLDDNGRKQAAETGKKLKGLIDGIIASDLDRTKETAAILSKETGTPIIAFTKGLRPWNVGVFTKQPAELVWKDLLKAIEEAPNEKLPEGESFNDFKTRFLKEIEHIEKHFKDRKLAIVTHHRNERTYVGWKKAGAKPDFEIDVKELGKKGIPPGAILIE